MGKVYRNDDWVKELYIKENMIDYNKEKESKRIKIESQFKTEGELIEFEKNIDKAFDDHLKLEEERKIKQKELRDAEEARIINLSCPSCKSKEKKLHRNSTSNGVIGPGYRKTTHEEYYICLDCGIHYTDVFKLKDK